MSVAAVFMRVSVRGDVMRDVFVSYIADKGPLNPAAAPLVDPANPRIKLEKPRTKKSPKRSNAQGQRRGHSDRRSRR